MPNTYDIHITKTGTERHSVTAESFEEALALYREGRADLRDDEMEGIDSITIVDRISGDKRTEDEIDNPEPAEEEEPELMDFNVSIVVTARVRADTTIKAVSLEAATEAAKALDPDDFYYTYEQDDGFEGDPIAFVREEEGSQEPVEIALPTPGEPFSWEAVQIVKLLAALHNNDGADQKADCLQLIARAHRACNKDS